MPRAIIIGGLAEESQSKNIIINTGGDEGGGATIPPQCVIIYDNLSVITSARMGNTNGIIGVVDRVITLVGANTMLQFIGIYFECKNS